MRLIDADVLVDMLYDNEFAMLCPLDEVSGVIDNCPTVAAVPMAAASDCETCRQKNTCLAYIPTMCRINCPLWRGKV